MTETFAESMKTQATEALASLDEQIAEAREIKAQNAAKIKRLLAERADMARIVTATSPRPRRKAQPSANGDD